MSEKRPTILLINRVFPVDKGATGLRLYELTDFLARHGWNVTVLAAHGYGENAPLLHKNITVKRLRSGKTQHPVPFSHYPWLLVCFFIKALFTRRHDVTVTMTDPPFLAVLGPFLRLFKRTKLIHWSQDVYPDILPVLEVRLPRLFMAFLKKIMLFSLKRYDAVIAIGRDMAHMFREKGLDEKKIYTINNWPDCFLIQHTGKETEKHNPYAHPDVVTFLYSGNFGLAHDFEIILDGIKLLEQKKEPFRFIFSGHGRRYDEVREQAVERELESVQFLSFQPGEKVKELLSAGDVHLANMRPEGLGLLMPSKVNSAFAFGKPLIFIGPSQSEAAQLIKEYGAGAVIDPSDHNARFSFARAVTDIGLHKKIWSDAARGSKKCAEAISIEKTGDAFEKLALYLIADKKIQIDT